METQLDKRFGFLVADVDRLCGNRFEQIDIFVCEGIRLIGLDVE